MDAFKKSIGFTNQQTSEKAGETPLEEYTNEDIINLSFEHTNVGSYTLEPLRKNVTMNQLEYVQKDVFDLMLRKMPNLRPVRRVLYKLSNRISVENFPILTHFHLLQRSGQLLDFGVVFLAKSYNLSDLTQIVSSNFVKDTNKFDLYLLKEITETQLNSVKECRPDKRIDSLAPLQLLPNSHVVIRLTLSSADFKTRAKHCSTCNQTPSVASRIFCQCGQVYCDLDCDRCQPNYNCTPLICAHCKMSLSRSEMSKCNCGELYCSDDCQKNDADIHRLKCDKKAANDSLYSANYNFNGPFPRNNNRGWGREEEDEKPLTSDHEGRVGLSNLGNTCYMNSALQNLLHLVALKDYLN